MAGPAAGTLLWLPALLALASGFGTVSPLAAQPAPELPLLASVAPDLTVPAMEEGEPAAGKRVRWVTPGWEGTQVHCALWLPADWQPGRSLPVMVELPGNGGYQNKLGDVCDGSVEGCNLGYGLSGGKGVIWVCAPFVEVAGDTGEKRNALKWWGDVEESKRHLKALVREVCQRWGGDADRVLLGGFSRGSIGSLFFGLHDDTIAPLWKGFFCHSHFDGALEHWPYPGARRQAALSRLRRLQGRPVWISHEESTAAAERWLAAAGVAGRWLFTPIPFCNHSDAWVLRPIDERERARAWLASVLELNPKKVDVFSRIEDFLLLDDLPLEPKNGQSSAVR